MARPSDIGWGSYRGWEGPFYKGQCSYTPRAIPSRDECILSVLTATEGGRYDAINMYDGQIISSGLIQWIERGQYSVSDMLGRVKEECPEELDLDFDGVTFIRNERGRWRFHFLDERGEVDREQEQRELMHGRSSGAKGTWSESDKELAKRWASCVASVWESPKAQSVQRDFTMPKLRKFAFGDSVGVVREAEQRDTSLCRAFVAAYLSFAGNNPVRANKHLNLARINSIQPVFTRDWLIDVLCELTFGPKISIYPHRYNAIRPVLERLYGVNLPDFADELEKWKKSTGHEFFFSTAEVQEALLVLGYDLGPAGADGKYGPKTREAVRTFEQLHELPADGMMDPMTARVLSQELEARGFDVLR